MITVHSMKQALLWSIAGMIAIVLAMMIFLPANWMAAVLESRSGGRLTLGDAQGTLWNGSAFIGGAYGRSDPVTPLLPGRFSWHVSPMVLLGMVDVKLENPEVLSQPVKLTGGWFRLQISPASITMPAAGLSALGAPLNTIQPSGSMKLSWSPLQLARVNGAVDLTGSMQLDVYDAASRLSAVKPLGNYNLSIDWQGQTASLLLRTDKGPLLLNGQGTMDQRTFRFSGTAEAASGEDEKLGNFLNLLGPHRREGNRDIIALEFR